MTESLAFKTPSRIRNIGPDVYFHVACLEGGGHFARSKGKYDVFCGDFLIVAADDNSLYIYDILTLKPLEELLVT